MPEKFDLLGYCCYFFVISVDFSLEVLGLRDDDALLLLILIF